MSIAEENGHGCIWRELYLKDVAWETDRRATSWRPLTAKMIALGIVTRPSLLPSPPTWLLNLLTVICVVSLGTCPCAPLSWNCSSRGLCYQPLCLEPQLTSGPVFSVNCSVLGLQMLRPALLTAYPWPNASLLIPFLAVYRLLISTSKWISLPKHSLLLFNWWVEGFL